MTLHANHPLRSAHWIWPRDTGCRYNRYAQFRYDVSLRVVPRRAWFYITADQCYMLYVNGRYVTRGPARGFQWCWSFDKVDLAPYLRRGRNRICILAYNAGISTCQYLHQGAAGVLAAGEWDGKRIATGEGWRMRIAPGYRRDTARLGVTQNFQEDFDARRDDGAWLTSNRLPKGNGWVEWRQGYFRCPFGASPWHDLEPRDIDLLGNKVMPYRAGVSVGTGPMAPGWRTDPDLALSLFKEIPAASWRMLKSHGHRTDPPELFSERSDDGLTVTVPPGKTAGRFSALCCDMGTLGIGTLLVEAAGSDGNVVDVFFTEGIDGDGRPALAKTPDDACRAHLVTRLTLSAGVARHETFQMIGHRYAVVIVRQACKPVTLKLALRNTTYPVRTVGQFECDDRDIEDIYRISVRTQEVCSLDGYVDTPWREQAQWWGDARIQGQNTFHLSGKTELLRRGIRCIARQQIPNGLTYGHAPTTAHNCILPDFTLIWMLTIWDYYYQTGKLDVFLEQWPAIQRALNYFTTEGAGKRGLLAYDERYWLFLDWTDLFKDGYSAVYNLWYLYTLQKLVELTGLAKLWTEHRRVARLAEKQQRLCLWDFWDGKQKLFRDGVKLDGAKVRRYSVHTQVLAILCGLQPRHHAGLIERRICPYIRGRKLDSGQPTSYWASYVYDVLTAAGYGQDVANHLRKHWTPMIATGGCWEMFPSNISYPPGGHKVGYTSISHAWAAHPIFHLVRLYGGVRQMDAAWKKIRFSPLLGETTMSRCRVVVPTPQGVVRSRWRRKDDGRVTVRLSLPKHVKAEVVLPGRDVEIVTGESTWEVRP